MAVKNQCENCHYFSGDKHKNDPRTKHAGICSKWTEVVFRTENCKEYFSSSNAPADEIFKPLIDVNQLPPVTQLNLFN
jgi:hypothetical protein